tara:strand:+ start:1742 stop:2731 length:990 start_codon:yes stop_codon:yes gene_type:complete
MARYTRGKHAVLMDDIFGRKIKYKDARTQWDGKRVYKGDFTPKHPQLEPQKYMKLDGTDALKDPRPDNDGANQTITVQLGSLHGKFSGQIAVQPPLEPPRLGLSLLDTPVTGLAATSQFSLPGKKSAEPVTGIEMTSANGSTGLFFNSTEVPPSQLATSSQGTIALLQAEEADGQQATSGQGSVTFSSADQPDGLEATSAQGTVGFFIAQVAPVTGIEMTAQQGTTEFLQAEPVSGIEATSGEGTANIVLNFTENVPGLSMTSEHGGPGFSFNSVEVPPGIQATSQQGTIAINTAHPVSGLSSTAQRGTIAVAFPGYGLNPWGHGTWGN